MAAARRKEFQKQIRRCDAALASEPKDAASLRRRGEAKRKLGQFAEACADFDAALVIEPHSAAAYAGRGAAKRAMLRYREAVDDFNAALDLQPRSVPVLVGRGAARRAMGQSTEAVADLDEALRIEPGSSLALQLRGELKRKLGDLAGAIVDFDAALEMQPNYAAALAGRGAAKRALGKHDEAIVDYDAALILEPQTPAMLSGRGAAKLEMGRHQEALSDFEQALKLDPTDAYATWGHSEASKRQGKAQFHVITLRGFERAGTDVPFLERRSTEYTVGGHETYWAATDEHFLFWCKKERRWKCSRAGDIEKIRAGGSAAAVLGAPEGEDIFSPMLQSGWFEWDGNEWKHRPNAGIESINRVSAAEKDRIVKLHEPEAKLLRTFTLDGFQSPMLNKKFVEQSDASFAIAGMVTYWSLDNCFFVYYCHPENRWKCSRQEDFEKIQAGRCPGVVAAPVGKDLFEPAKLKGWLEWTGNAWELMPKAGIMKVGAVTIKKPK